MLALIVSWLVMETTAYLGLVYLDKSWSPYQQSSKIAENWQQQAGRVDDREASPPSNETPAWSEEKVPHPYLGATSLRLQDEVVQPVKRGEDRIVVGIFGGSVALQVAKLGAEDLKSALSKAYDKPVQIVDLAGGALKQPQQLMVLSYFLSQGNELDIALCLDGFNEVSLHGVSNERAGIHPSYPFGWRSRAVNAVTGRTAAALGRRELARQEVLAVARAALVPWARLPSAQLFYRLRLAALGERWSESQEQVVAESVVKSPPFSGDPYPSLIETWVNGTVQMNKLCRANGIAFYEFLQPNQYWPGSKTMSVDEQAIAIDPDHVCKPGVERGYPLLIAAGPKMRAAGVEFSDLSGVFGQVREPVYADTCCHLNALGIRILTEAIAQRIIDSRYNGSYHRKLEKGSAP